MKILEKRRDSLEVIENNKEKKRILLTINACTILYKGIWGREGMGIFVA